MAQMKPFGLCFQAWLCCLRTVSEHRCLREYCLGALKVAEGVLCSVMQWKLWKNLVVWELQVVGPDEGKPHAAHAQKGTCGLWQPVQPFRGLAPGSAVPEFLSGSSGGGILWLQKGMMTLSETSVGPLHSFTIYKLYPLVAIRLSIDHSINCSFDSFRASCELKTRSSIRFQFT